MRLTFRFYSILFLSLGIAFFLGCQKPNATSQNGRVSTEKTPGKAIPDWLKEKITGFEKDKPADPPVKIYSYLYHNQEVYYITGRCCDIPSEVSENNGKQLCQPDGGITGRGDGKCADFFTARTNEKLIWEDLRK